MAGNNFKGCQLYIGDTPVAFAESSKIELAKPEVKENNEPTNWGGSYSWNLSGDLLINQKTIRKLLGIKRNKRTRRERHIYNVWRKELKRVKLNLPMYSEFEHKRRMIMLYHVVNYINNH